MSMSMIAIKSLTPPLPVYTKMNLALLSPFEQDFPETVDTVLPVPGAVCCAFDPRGVLLALGCMDGRTVLCDIETRTLPHTLVPSVDAVGPITALR